MNEDQKKARLFISTFSSTWCLLFLITWPFIDAFLRLFVYWIHIYIVDPPSGIGILASFIRTIMIVILTPTMFLCSLLAVLILFLGMRWLPGFIHRRFHQVSIIDLEAGNWNRRNLISISAFSFAVLYLLEIPYSLIEMAPQAFLQMSRFVEIFSTEADQLPSMTLLTFISLSLGVFLFVRRGMKAFDKL
jgi:hypothetical protein